MSTYNIPCSDGVVWASLAEYLAPWARSALGLQEDHAFDLRPATRPRQMRTTFEGFEHGSWDIDLP